MDYLPYDIILKIALRIDTNTLTKFFLTSKAFNLGSSTLFWKLRCEYEFNYDSEKYAKSELDFKTKYKLLKYEDIKDIISKELISELNFLKEAPKYYTYDFQSVFGNALENDKFEIVKLLMNVLRVDPNFTEELLFTPIFRYSQIKLINLLLDSDRFDPRLAGLTLEKIIKFMLSNNFCADNIDFVCKVIERLTTYDSAIKHLPDEYLINIILCNSFGKNGCFMIRSLLKHKTDKDILSIPNLTFLVKISCIYDNVEYIKNIANKLLEVYGLEHTYGLVFNYAYECNSIKILNYLLYDLNVKISRDHVFAVMNRGHNKMVKMLIAHPSFVRTEYEVTGYLTLNKCHKLLPFLWNYPEYQLTFRNQKNRVFDMFTKTLEHTKILVLNTDLILDDEANLLMLIKQDKEDSNPILEYLLSNNRIDLNKLGNFALKKCCDLLKCKSLSLFLNHPHLRVYENEPVFEIKDLKTIYNTIHNTGVTQDFLPECYSIGQRLAQSSVPLENFSSQLCIYLHTKGSIDFNCKKEINDCIKCLVLLFDSPNIDICDETLSRIIESPLYIIIEALIYTKRFKKYIDDKIKDLYIGLIDAPLDVFELFLSIPEFDPCAHENILLFLSLKRKYTVKLDFLLEDDRVKERYDYELTLNKCCEYGTLECFQALTYDKETIPCETLLRIAVENSNNDIVVYILEKFTPNIDEYKDDLIDECDIRDNDDLCAVLETYC